MIGDERIVATDSAKNIGVVLDTHHHMYSQINSICRSSYVQLHFIRKIKPFLTLEAVSALLQALVTSRLDNCNSLLSGCYEYLLKRLQMVQNCAACLVLDKRKYDHITSMLVELHCLPVKERIVYKICLVVFKCINNSAPQYLSGPCHPIQKGMVTAIRGHLPDRKVP